MVYILHDQHSLGLSQEYKEGFFLSITNNSLFEPIMYMINESIKRNNKRKETHDFDYVEGVTLHRKPDNTLDFVDGSKYMKTTLKYNDNGTLGTVHILDKTTGKELLWTLTYEDFMLKSAIPEILNNGSGAIGEIGLPEVI